MVKRALERATVDGLNAMQQKAPTVARVVNGWQMNTDTIGIYGNCYLERALVGLRGSTGGYHLSAEHCR